MLEDAPATRNEELEEIARRRPVGALTVCGIAVAIVVVVWFLFYFFAFLPRGFTQ
jgi:hypothetical protein